MVGGERLAAHAPAQLPKNAKAEGRAWLSPPRVPGWGDSGFVGKPPMQALQQVGMGNRMIFVTRLAGSEVVINSDLIVTVEKTPDTVITLTTGDRIMVKESVEDVVERAAAFRHRV